MEEIIKIMNMQNELIYRAFRIIGYAFNPAIRSINHLPKDTVFQCDTLDNYHRETQDFFYKYDELQQAIEVLKKAGEKE